MTKFEVHDENYAIGATKVIYAPTLEGLRLALNQLSKENFNLEVGWNGWDDESLIGHCRGPRLHIEPRVK